MTIIYILLGIAMCILAYLAGYRRGMHQGIVDTWKFKDFQTIEDEQ